MGTAIEQEWHFQLLQFPMCFSFTGIFKDGITDDKQDRQADRTQISECQYRKTVNEYTYTVLYRLKMARESYACNNQ